MWLWIRMEVVSSLSDNFPETFPVDLVKYLLTGLPLVVVLYALLLCTRLRRVDTQLKNNSSRRKRTIKRRLPPPQKSPLQPFVNGEAQFTPRVLMPRAAAGGIRISSVVCTQHISSPDEATCAQHAPSLSGDSEDDHGSHNISRLGLVLTNNACQKCGLVAAKRRCRYDYCGGCCRAKYMSVCGAHNTGVRVAEQLMDEALRIEPYELDLSYQHLRFCPNRIGDVGCSLTSLNLSNNRLVSLPEEVGNLVSLEELFLQYNCLQVLPDSLGNFTFLKEFDCKNNQLSSVPESLGKLTDLNILNLTNNRLQTLPRSVGQMSKLEELCLHANCLSELPAEISNLGNLTVLYLGDNRLKSLPRDIGNLRRLTELDVSNNELAAIPESLVHCTALTRLWLSYNRLTALPTRIGCLGQLLELHVRHNQCRFFPLSLTQLKLFTFTSSENPLLTQWNRAAIRKLECRPLHRLPTLLESSARAVVRYKVNRQPGDLPCHLEDMLSSVHWCSNCYSPFFSFYSSQLVFCTVAVFFRLPLLEIRCCPHNDKLCPPYIPS